MEWLNSKWNNLIYWFTYKVNKFIPNKSLGECPNTAGKFLDTLVILPV